MFSKAFKALLVVTVVAFIVLGVAIANPGAGTDNNPITNYLSKCDKGKVASANSNKTNSARYADKEELKGEVRVLKAKAYNVREERKEQRAKRFGNVAGTTLLVKNVSSTNTAGSLICTTSTVCATRTVECTPTTGTVCATSTVDCTTTLNCTRTPSPTIDGTCTPLKGVHLRLYIKKGKKLVYAPVRATQSNKRGEFVFKNVRPGNYVLKVWAWNAKPNNGQLIPVKVTGGCTTNVGAIKFTPRSTIVRPPSKDTTQTCPTTTTPTSPTTGTANTTNTSN